MNAKEKFEKFKDYLNQEIVKLLPPWLTPNHLTFFRIFLFLPFTYFLIRESYSFALFIFLFALFTDSLDGSLARLRKKKTKLGTILDPIADRLLFIITVLVLGFRFYSEKTVIYLSVSLEFSIIAVLFKPLLEQASGKKISTEANIFGKIKLILEGLAMTILLFNQSSLISFISMIILWLAVVFMTLSIIYVFVVKKEKINTNKNRAV